MTKRLVSLDELIALNDEIGALAKSGLPLDRGLRLMARDLPGRLGELADSLGERIANGEDVAAAIQRIAHIPAAYRAVLEAGIRSGRLSVALEGIATTARRSAEIRRLTFVAMLYPMIVLTVGVALLQFTALNTSPVLVESFDVMGIDQPGWYKFQTKLMQSAAPVLPWVWGTCLLVFAIWWIRTWWATGLQTSRKMQWLFPSGIAAEGRLATFAEVLALLIEQKTALPEALQLAADASGDPRLESAGSELAERIRRGEGHSSIPAGMPPLLCWLLVSGGTPEQLARMLRKSAEHHRRRAVNRGRWLSVYLPALLAGGVGGVFALFYVVFVMAPFYHLLHQLN